MFVVYPSGGVREWAIITINSLYKFTLGIAFANFANVNPRDKSTKLGSIALTTTIKPYVMYFIDSAITAVLLLFKVVLLLARSDNIYICMFPIRIYPPFIPPLIK